MYTIDGMIERLQELKSVAKDGGETPVVINISDHESEAAGHGLYTNVGYVRSHL